MHNGRKNITSTIAEKVCHHTQESLYLSLFAHSYRAEQIENFPEGRGLRIYLEYLRYKNQQRLTNWLP